MKRISLSVLLLTALLLTGKELKLSAPQVITHAWGGTMKKQKDHIELRVTQKGKLFLCRMRRQILSPLSLWGRKTLCTFSASGTGKLTVSYYCITSLYSEKFVSQSKTISLSKEWKEYKIPLFSTEPDVRRCWVLLTLTGKNASARIKDQRLLLPETPGREITCTSRLTVVPEKKAAALTFRAPGRKTLRGFDGRKEVVLKGKNGRFTLNIPADAAPIGKKIRGSVLGETVRAGVWDEKTNAACSTYLSRLSELQWSNFVNVSQQIKLKKNLSVLFLGDSLSDFSRGFNYTDELDFWISRNNPGKYSFCNAGIAGYTFKALYLNLARRPGARNLERTQHIWKKKYDLIFVFLGHNDTVQYYNEDHTPRKTDQIKELNTWLPLLVKTLRSRSQAKIVLVSPASMDHDKALAFSNKRKRPGQRYYLFAKPENLVPFCREMKKLAAKLGTDFVDMYSPTRALPEKHRYFTEIDGVHLMPRGQHVIAFELLKYLAGTI